MQTDDDDFEDLSLTPTNQSLASIVVGKLISRKLVVFVVATIFFATGHITDVEWLGFASLYAGIQGTIDMITSFANKRKQ